VEKRIFNCGAYGMPHPRPVPFHPPGDCPVCGAAVQARSRACPDCGADERSGWRGEDAGDGLDLPDESFDYDAFVQEEFGGAPAAPRGIRPLWWIIGIVLVATLAIALLR
jgi:hypothetical protein